MWSAQLTPAKSGTHLAFVLLHPSAGRLVDHHLRASPGKSFHIGTLQRHGPNLTAHAHTPKYRHDLVFDLELAGALVRFRPRGGAWPVAGPSPRKNQLVYCLFEVQALMWGGFAAAAGRHREATTGRRDRAQLASSRRRSYVRREGKGKRHLASLAFDFARGSTDT